MRRTKQTYEAEQRNAYATDVVQGSGSSTQLANSSYWALSGGDYYRTVYWDQEMKNFGWQVIFRKQAKELNAPIFTANRNASFNIFQLNPDGTGFMINSTTGKITPYP